MGKYKKIFISPRSNRNRIELDPVTSIDRNPLPAYTYGAGANETFPGIFPTVRKEGIGVVGDVSTPTFSGSEGEGKEINFFNTKKEIDKFIKKHWGLDNMDDNKVTKAWIYYQEGEKIPKNAITKIGKKGGRMYWGQLAGRRYKESTEISSQEWQKPTGNYSPGGIVIPSTWSKCLVNSDPKAPMQIVGINNYGKFAMIRSREWENVGVLKHFMQLKKLSEKKDGKRDITRIKEQLEKEIKNTTLPSLQRQSAFIYLTQMQTGFRIGSYSKTPGKIPSFGVATLQLGHVSTFSKDYVRFNFMGKSGSMQKRTIKSPTLAAYIRNRKDTLQRKGFQGKKLAKQRLFPDVSWKKSQKYLDAVSLRAGVKNLAKDKNGKLKEHYTSHDFRRYMASWTANDIISKWLRTNEPPKTTAELDKLKNYVGTKVANEILHNRPDVALAKYITPITWEKFSAPTTAQLNSQKAPPSTGQGTSHLKYKDLTYGTPSKQKKGKGILNSMDSISKAKSGSDFDWWTFEDMLENVSWADNEKGKSGGEQKESNQPELENIKNKINKMIAITKAYIEKNPEEAQAKIDELNEKYESDQEVTGKKTYPNHLVSRDWNDFKEEKKRGIENSNKCL